MKDLLLTILVLAGAVSAHAQGTVVFANTSSTLITTNTGTGAGPMSGVGNFRIGLYIGPAGAAQHELVLAGTALSSAIPGRFSGGNPYTLSSSPAGMPIKFQIRGWTAAAGASYEEALASGIGIGGASALGIVTPAASPNPPAPLFGTGPGQVGGFAMGIPEPSTIAIGCLGLGALVLLQRRKQS